MKPLIDELLALRKSVLAFERRQSRRVERAHPSHRASATNLAHYLALRREDLRGLQERLSRLGVSSLGRAETHVLANLDKVLGLLHVLDKRKWKPKSRKRAVGYERGRELLARNAEALFGPEPAGRSVRIMVTLPSEAAGDRALVAGLVAGGMDIARINCAHDDAEHWIRMARNVRSASKAAGRTVRILMDLGGPKLRTGPIEPGPAVLHVKPRRDAFGRVVAPAIVELGTGPAGSPGRSAGPRLEVDARWLGRLREGERIACVDARGAHRELAVQARLDTGVAVACDHACYFTPETRLRVRRKGERVDETGVGGIAPRRGRITLRLGDVVHVVRSGTGHDARNVAARAPAEPATLACLPPEALDPVRKGERIWFDDGRIGGVVTASGEDGIVARITVAREGGESLLADKGINLPDTALDMPALSGQDVEDLAVVAKCADIVGLSFAQSAADVNALRKRLRAATRRRLGIILKIETRRGFEHLPEMLFAAMAEPAAGVMIARGDLAVECGYERMAEVQEEILWACEAGHLPVVWATQVLESLAKTGLPSRAEITDAAMGERAECVMLNKGPHILEAIRTLDDILKRMQTHQAKKRPLLRALKAWERSLRAKG